MNAKLIQVIATEHCRGLGSVDDPCRIVTACHSLDGELLAEVDPCGNLSARKESTTVAKLESATLVDRNPALENVLAKLRVIITNCEGFEDSYLIIDNLTLGDLRRWVESENKQSK